jgi:putative alpha-1,2-mannosidase
MYFNDPEGLAGNEDVGQMSAWYVLSAMGFYQVEPALPRYWFGAPLFDKMTVKVPGGELVIIAKGAGEKKPHIKSVKFNGKPYTLPYIQYEDLIQGGTLEFEMGK